MTTTHTAATLAYTKERPAEPGLYLCWYEGDDTPTLTPVVEGGEYGLCARAQYIGGKLLTPVKNNRFDDAYWVKLPACLDWNPHDDDN